MKFNPLDQTHIKNLQSMVAPDRFSTGESNLELHSKDQSHHYPSLPEAVIWPVNREEISGILDYSNNHLIPVTGWGSGTSLEGNPIPLQGGLVLDFSRMNRILDVREEDFQADVEPGVIYQDLNEGLRHKGLFFPPDPGARATIGGMIANNASGTRTVRYGSTKDHILRLSVALANGDIIEAGNRASKTSSGYDLIHLFVGSEGTLGIVVEATIRLIGLPAEFSAAIVTFPSVEEAGKAVFEIIRSGFDPAALELLDPECIKLINREKDLGLKVSPTLFTEFHGPTKNQLAEVMKIVQEICKGNGCTEFRSGLGREERDRLFKARYELGEMIIRSHPDCGILVIDVALPNTAYPEIIAFAREIKQKMGIPGYIFGHAGDGNLHLNLAGKKSDKREWELIDEVASRMVTKALALGGTATGEHGVGIGKSKFMEAEHGRSLEWMKRIKSLFDPKGILNPGKIFLRGPA
ncbi:MAG: FAD-binding oxidoreductase [Thermodesulfobacteriota bacterium]|nr:FAD-binding oxidoreductase [Thermodesulfobacteriota bacterium]